MCKDFVSCLMERMTAQGMKGELLTLKSETDFIWSNTFNRTITTNGDHVGIKVGNMVIDNLYTKGIKYSKWLKDLEVGSPILGMPQVTPF
ncbi:papain fold toxin domain-containing protein [Chryseobacterium rhizosphaerae]|uniref:papain fold toxin domain-containing protein n=1 Tax=Chryseobacterium rhizosphaerae TaxID=395937 RepID=UPI003D11020B